MNFITNDWNAIRSFYAEITPLIMAEEKNEWALGAYCWEERPMIFQTPIENWLWHDIRACDAVLYPQYPVLNFFVDFANPKAMVAVECDGAAYHQNKAKDAERDRRLELAGWTVYRISGSDCRKDSDPDTGAPSVGHQFIQAICDIHGISRQTAVRSDEWSHVRETISDQVMSRFSERKSL